jgi:hypothetical protein
MQMKKLVLATAVAIVCSSAFAANHVRQEPCEPGASCEPVNTSIGIRTIKEFREAGLIPTEFSIHLPEGEVAEFCPDIKGEVWPFKNGLATPFSKDNKVIGEAFRADGVTPLTPSSCLMVVGTGNKEIIKVLWRITFQKGYLGVLNPDVVPVLVRAE